jgi:hypothetical protein
VIHLFTRTLNLTPEMRFEAVVEREIEAALALRKQVRLSGMTQPYRRRG